MQVWDIRTKANVHTLTGHTNTVATVRCQAAEPQIITGKFIYFYFFFLKKTKLFVSSLSVEVVADWLVSTELTFSQAATIQPSGCGI